jgi:Recombination endonuclease VII
VDCQRRYVRQHTVSRDDRELMRGKPCDICTEPMEQPCFDEIDGALRGWLCHHCNIGLGQFRERADLLLSAIDYLKIRRGVKSPS